MASDLHLCMAADIALGDRHSEDAGLTEALPGLGLIPVTRRGEQGTSQACTEFGSEETELSVAKRAKERYRQAQGRFWR